MTDLIYLDHAATSWPKPPEVCEQMTRALVDLTANAGRSGHQPSIESARIVFQTREGLASLLGVAQSEDLVFVRGCTEGLNLVIKGFLEPGDTVAVSPMEHNSAMRPLMRLTQRCDVKVETLPADPFGRIDVEATGRIAGTKRFALVAISHASNVNGAVQDIRGLRAAFPETPILIDAAQTAGVLPINVQQDGIDFLACSVHKGLLGPTGVGACYLSSHYDVRPLQEGGTGSQSESQEHPGFRPDRYEAGTSNLHGIAGTLGALQSFERRGLLGAQKRQLTQVLLEGLRTIPGVRIQSPIDETALCASFTVDRLRPDEVAARLEEQHGILCRPGLQCAPAAHRHLQTFPQGTVRLSPGWKNTPEDIEAALRAIHAVAKSV
jgi:cysteine desulfurase family protein